MVRYGINNFTRNAWLTTAATAVMTVTLVIIFIAVITRVLIGNTITAVEAQTDVQIPLDPKASARLISEAKQKVEELEAVKTVSIISTEEVKQDYISTYNPSPATLASISDLPSSPFFPKMKIVPSDPNDLTEIAKFFQENEQVAAV
ncbi:hypothetical protein B7Z17_03785, partial [Candidatus Saccharibacteria bacterium 32-49-10]